MATKNTVYFWQEQLDDQSTRLGLTPQAQDELGRVKFVDLPTRSGTLEDGDTLIAVEAEKAVLDLPTPISGTVQKVHTELADDPSLMNSTDHEDNWIIEIKTAKN